MDEIQKSDVETCSSNICRHNMTYEDGNQVRVHHKQDDLFLTANNTENLHSASSVVKHNGFLNVIDQTPTPTRFFKHYEDVCLFQDINLNPFDLEFRKASQNKSSKVHLSLAENHGISGSLDTPRILPPIESDETISSTSHDDGHASSENRRHPQFSSIITAPSPSEIFNQRQNELNAILEEKKDVRKRLTLNVSSASEESQSNSNIISTPTPVITAGPSVSQSLIGVGCSTPTLNTPNIVTTNIPHISLNGSGLELNDLCTPTVISPNYRPSASPTQASNESINEERPAEDKSKFLSKSLNENSTIPSSSNSFGSTTSATVLQLLLRLPSGEAIPVEIPATPVMSTLSSPKTNSNVVPTIVPAFPATIFKSVITNPTSSFAKMKLKQVLTSSNTAARPGAQRHSRATTADRIADLTKPKISDAAISKNVVTHNVINSNECEAGVSGSGGIKLARKKISSPEEDPEEKRKKFLERNRVAAVRCREKKKRLVENIVAKSDEVNYMNQRLQGEVTALRSEVATLKSLLLKHKNCPVTLAMQEKNNFGGEHEAKDYQGHFERKQSACELSDPTLISSSPQFISADSYKELPNSLHNSSNSFLIPENPSIDASKFRKRSHSLSSIPLQSILVKSEVGPNDARIILPAEGSRKEPKQIAPKEAMIICKSSYGIVPSSSRSSSTFTQPKIIFIENSSVPVSVPSQR